VNRDDAIADIGHWDSCLIRQCERAAHPDALLGFARDVGVERGV
jgi:hypothetical protein